MDTETVPVRGALPGLCIPIFRGSPVAQAQAEQLYVFLTGGRVVDFRTRAAEARADLREGIERDADRQDDAVRTTVVTFLAVVAHILDLDRGVVRFETQDGVPVDRATLRWTAEVAQNLRGLQHGFQGRPPRLADAP